MSNDNPAVPPHQEGWNELAKTVRPLLSAALAGINPDEVFFNGVNNLTERLVIHSASLTNEAVQRILEKDEPTYTFITGGVFSVAYSFADEHRVSGLDPENLTEVMTHLVRTLG